jgi:hypothetical protein
VIQSPVEFYHFLPLDRLSLVVVRSIRVTIGNQYQHTFAAFVYDDIQQSTPGKRECPTKLTRNLELKEVWSPLGSPPPHSRWSISASFQHFDVDSPNPTFEMWKASGMPLLLHHEYAEDGSGSDGAADSEAYQIYPSDFEVSPVDSETRYNRFVACLSSGRDQAIVFHGQMQYILFKHWRSSSDDHDDAPRITVSRERYEPQCWDTVLGCRDDPDLVPVTQTRQAIDNESYTDLCNMPMLYNLLCESRLRMGDWDDHGIGRFVFVTQPEGSSLPHLNVFDYRGC